MPTSQPQSEDGRLPMPSKNPIPLSSSQEAQVREIFHRRVREKCTNELKEFAECVTGLTFTASYRCRQQKLAVNSCMLSNATPEEEDRAREEWFALRGVRKEEAERREELKKKQEEFHREWWERDEKGEKVKGTRSLRRYPT